MASGIQKGVGAGLGGAGTGAMVGSAIGGPGLGTVIGGGVGAAAGFLGGFFQGDDEEPVYQSRSFADINLRKENPELYQELMNMKAQEKVAMDNYYARRGGQLSVDERAQVNQAMGNQAQALQARGLAGTSIGMASQEAAEARIRQELLDRSYKESLGYLDQAHGYQKDYIQGLSGAQNDIMRMEQGAYDKNYEADLAEMQASNQFYSGLANAGIGMGAQAFNTYEMSKLRSQPNDPRSGTVGPGGVTHISSGYGSAFPQTPPSAAGNIYRPDPSWQYGAANPGYGVRR